MQLFQDQTVESNPPDCFHLCWNTLHRRCWKNESMLASLESLYLWIFTQKSPQVIHKNVITIFSATKKVL